MTIEESEVTVTVYHYSAASKMHLVKVNIPSIGLYISSITVSSSPKYPDSGLWVQAPRFNVKGSWVRPCEFTKNSPLWDLIRRLAILAIEQYILPEPEITDMTKEEFDQLLKKGIDNMPP